MGKVCPSYLNLLIFCENLRPQESASWITGASASSTAKEDKSAIPRTSEPDRIQQLRRLLRRFE